MECCTKDMNYASVTFPIKADSNGKPTINLCLGTPSKCFDAYIDFSTSALLTIPKPDIKVNEVSQVNGQIFYVPSQSSTSSGGVSDGKSIFAGTQNFKGKKYKDSLKLNNQTTLTDFEFLLADEMTDSSSPDAILVGKISPIIGLGFFSIYIQLQLVFRKCNSKWPYSTYR